MEVNRSQRPSHSTRKPNSPSTPISVSPYLRDATNRPTAAPFTPRSYSTPKSSSFLSHLKTPTVPQRASSANFRVAPSPSRRAPTRGGAHPQSSPHQVSRCVYVHVSVFCTSGRVMSIPALVLSSCILTTPSTHPSLHSHPGILGARKTALRSLM